MIPVLSQEEKNKAGAGGVVSLDTETNSACCRVLEGRVWRCPEWGDTGWEEEETQGGGGEGRVRTAESWVGTTM